MTDTFVAPPAGTEIFATPDDAGPLRASDLRSSSMEESLAAQAGEALFGGTRTAYRIGEYRAASAPTLDQATAAMNAGDKGAEFALRGPAHGVGTLHDFTTGESAPPPPEIPLEQAQAQVKAAGLDQVVKLPAQPSLRQGVLDLMIRDGHEKAEYDAAVARGPHGFLPGALGFVTQIGAGLLDPVNDAAFMIPVLGEANEGRILAAAGESIFGRGAANFAIGASRGAAGMTPLTAADWWLHTQDGQDYTMADAMRSIVQGAVMGGTFHAGLGGLGDLYARARGRALPGGPQDLMERRVSQALGEGEPAPPAIAADEVPGIAAATRPPAGEGLPLEEAFPSDVFAGEEGVAPHADPAGIFADLPAGAREDLVHAAAADVLADRPGRAGEVLAIAAAQDPRIAQSAEGATVLPGPRAARGPRARDERTYSLFEYLAHRGGLAPHPDLEATLGSNPFVPGFGRLVRRTGMSLDRAREAAVEGGYLHEPGNQTGGLAESTVNHLLEAIDREGRGSRVYRIGEGHAGEARAARHAAEENLHRINSEIDATFAENGLEAKSLPDRLRARVVEIMDREGVRDPLAAYERAVLEEDRNAVERGRAPAAEPIPGWDVPDDAGAASRPGAGARAVAPGARPASPAAGGDAARARAVDLDAWRRLGAERAGPDAVADAAASRAAQDEPEPASTQAPARAVSAAEQEAAKAEAALEDLGLTQGERKRIQESLAEIAADRDARESIIRDGAACLMAAIA